MTDFITLTKLFEMRSLISLAHSMNQTTVKELQDALSNLLRAPISTENIDEWIDKNPALEKSNIKKHIGYDKYRDKIELSFDGMTDEGEFISPSADEPSDWKNKEITFLLGTDKIPNLYKIKGKRLEVSDSQVKDLPKNLAQYGFIIGVINSINNQEDKSIPLEYSLQGMANVSFKQALYFIQDNKTKIDSLFKLFEYNPKQLGAGVDGVAFDIGKNKVLKIYTSQSTHNNNLQFYNNLYDKPEMSKTEMMIYDIGSLGSLEDGDELFYIVTEKMVPTNKFPFNFMEYLSLVNQSLTKRLREDQDEWAIYKSILNGGTKEEVIRAINEIKRYSEYVTNDIDLTLGSEYKYMKYDEAAKDFAEENNMPENWIAVYVEEIIVKLLTNRGDLHFGNLGLNNSGYLRFFDSYHKSWENGLNMNEWRKRQYKVNEQDAGPFNDSYQSYSSYYDEETAR